LYCFAIIGFGLCVAYFAIHFKWTNEKGSVDVNSRYLETNFKKNISQNSDSLNEVKLKYQAINRISFFK
jgi:hypothetical protein